MRDNDGGGPGGGAGAENRDVSPVRLADTRNGGRTCELGGGIQQFLETVGRSVRQRETVSMPVKRDHPVDEPGESLVSELVPGAGSELLTPEAGTDKCCQSFRQIVEMFRMRGAVGVGPVDQFLLKGSLSISSQCCGSLEWSQQQAGDVGEFR